MVNFRIGQNDCLYIAKVLDEFIEPAKISILITGVSCGKLKWRARHHTLALIVAVTDRIKEVVVALEHLSGPIPPLDPRTSLTTEICGNFDNLSIYYWDKEKERKKSLTRGHLKDIGSTVGIQSYP